MKKITRGFGERIGNAADCLKNCPADRIVLPILFVGMFLKSFYLQCFIVGSSHYVPRIFLGLVQSARGLFFSLVTVTLLAAPLFLFKKSRGRLIYGFSVSILFLALTLTDGCYYRCYPEMPSLTLLGMVEGAKEEGHLNLTAVFDTFSVYDIFYLSDYAVLLALGLFRKFYKRRSPAKVAGNMGEAGQAGNLKETLPAARETANLPTAGKPKRTQKKEETRAKVSGKNRFWRFLSGTRPGRFLSVTVPCTVVLGILPLLNTMGLAKGAYRDIYEPAYSKDCALFFTPVGYHLADAFSMVFSLQSEQSFGADQADQIREFYDYNKENLPDNGYKGLYEGRNVFLIQVESLEAFPLLRTVFGKEITPNLNKLIAEDSSSLYFPHIYDQVKAGNSSDCDLMVNCSVLPTSKVFFRTYADKYLPSLPALLREKGYDTYYFNGSGPNSVWPYTDVYRDIFGYNTDENSPGCNFHLLEAKDDSEKIYRYISDEENFTRVIEELTKKTGNGRAFFSHIVLCSSHMPFDYIDEDLGDRLAFQTEERELKNSKTLAYLNCLRYVDEQIGKFLENAKSAGLLENSVVLIYGDHTGLHKYYPSDAAEIADEYEEFSFVNEEETAAIPLIVYDPSNRTEHRQFDTVGGQVDIMPTLCYLLGMDREDYGFAMGRALVNTSRNYTVLSNGVVIGDGKLNPLYREAIYRMYNTADLIVTLEYYKKDGNGKPT